jgi:hypothetical protein
MKEIEIKIPLLTGEDNLNIWRVNVLRCLEIHDLDKYILEDVKEPEGDAVTKKKWKSERLTVAHLLGTSLSDKGVERTLLAAGWDISESNPKVTYDLVKKVIPSLTLTSVASMYREIATISRKQFPSMVDYTARLQELKNRLMNNTVIKQQDESFYVAMSLMGIQQVYPNEYAWLWRELENSNLDWNKLMLEFTTISNTEKLKTSNAALNVPKSGGDGKSKEKKKDGDKAKDDKAKDDKTCKVEGCEFRIFGKLSEHHSCGKHFAKGGFCYWCNPWAAPDDWKPKANRVKELDAARNANPAALNNSGNGIMNPPGGAPSLLNYSGFFEGVALTSIPMPSVPKPVPDHHNHHKDFQSGPRR